VSPAVPAVPAAPVLPAARTEGRYAVGLVCLGNICRSPMAHVVLEAQVAEAGLDDVVEVTSSGTGGWHVGDPMDSRAAATLREAGLDPSQHRARQFAASDWAELDLVLALDDTNRSDLGALDPSLGPEPGRLLLLGDLDPETPGAAVPDPYYGGSDGFTAVLAQVERCAEALVEALAEQQPWSPHRSRARA